MVLEDRGWSRRPVLLTEFGTHYVELLLHFGVVLPRIRYCLFEKVYVLDCPRESFPFAGFVGLAGR